MDVAPNRQQFENMAPNTSAVPVCSLTYQSASCLPQIIFFKSVQPPWQILSSKVLEMEISTMQPQLRLWKGHSSTVRKKKNPPNALMVVKINVEVLFVRKNEGVGNLAKFFWNSSFLLQGWKPHGQKLDSITELWVSKAPCSQEEQTHWLAKLRQDRKMGEQFPKSEADLSNILHIPVFALVSQEPETKWEPTWPGHALSNS